MNTAEAREKFSPENITCSWNKCVKNAKVDRIYFYGKETFCGPHLKRVDPDYKYQLDMADKQARNEEENRKYKDAEFGSHKQVKRPTCV